MQNPWPWGHPTTIQTPDYYTDTRLLYRHPTTIQTPNYYTDTQLLDRHAMARETQEGRGDEKATCVYIYIYIIYYNT